MFKKYINVSSANSTVSDNIIQFSNGDQALSKVSQVSVNSFTMQNSYTNINLSNNTFRFTVDNSDGLNTDSFLKGSQLLFDFSPDWIGTMLIVTYRYLHNNKILFQFY